MPPARTSPNAAATSATATRPSDTDAIRERRTEKPVGVSVVVVIAT